jgi:hypothetical protein
MQANAPSLTAQLQICPNLRPAPFLLADSILRKACLPASVDPKKTLALPRTVPLNVRLDLRQSVPGLHHTTSSYWSFEDHLPVSGLMMNDILLNQPGRQRPEERHPWNLPSHALQLLQGDSLRGFLTFAVARMTWLTRLRGSSHRTSSS